MNNQIILFDGVCNVCNGFVQFVIRYDEKQIFRFASQQSDTGHQLLNKHDAPALDSIFLVDGDKVYSKATAILKIVQSFGGGWKLVKILEILPSSVANWVYDVFAENRYKWFGQKEECMIPTPEIRQRFI